MASTTTSQTRTHSSHHHHDNAYLTSTNKSDAGVRITRIGLYVNLAMAIGKGIGGYVFHSQALSADAVHSLTDLVSDFMTLATVSWALKPPTEKFPFGYGKIESLGSLGVSSLLVFGGVLMGWSAIIDLCHIYVPLAAEILEELHVTGHAHGHSHQIPNIQAAWLAGGSVLVKEWLYRATLKVARERKSSVLESNAIHHRVDSLTGIAALLSIALSNVFPTFSGADAFGGLLISFMVIRAGWGNTWTALSELADASFDATVKGKVHRAATNAIADGFPGHSVEVCDIQGTKAGQNYLIEVEIAVPHDWSVGKTRAVEEAVRMRIGEKVRGARRVRVRFLSDESREQDFGEEFISPRVSARSSPEPEDEQQHDDDDHQHDDDDHHHHRHHHNNNSSSSSNYHNEHSTNQQNANCIKRRN